MKQLENGTFIKIADQEIYDAFVGQVGYNYDDVADAYVEVYDEPENYKPEWDELIVDAPALDDEKIRIIYTFGRYVGDCWGVRAYLKEVGAEPEDYGMESEEID